MCSLVDRAKSVYVNALQKLDDEIDAVVASAGRGRWSLCPSRQRATSLRELVHRDVTVDKSALSQAVFRVGRAQLDNFPGNLFWDFDAVVATLASKSTERELTETTERFVNLQRLYGQHSTVRFQYVHDFVYGFDWNRWIRERGGSASASAFGDEFLDYSIQRGHELLALIDEDDDKYPKLPTGALRNPFGFRREPSDEAHLFRALASYDLIPLRAWDAASISKLSSMTVDYHAERARVAAALGLSVSL